MISSPNGSAVWTGAVAGGAAGVSAAAGGAAGVADGVVAGLAAGGGAGVVAGAGVDGVLDAGGAAGGDCASAWPRPRDIAAAGTSAIMARRIVRKQFISGFSRVLFGVLTRRAWLRPMTDASWTFPFGEGPRHRFAALANLPLLAI
jgi:hypothetical protein